MDLLSAAGVIVAMVTSFVAMLLGLASLWITLADRRERKRAHERADAEAQARRNAVTVSISALSLGKIGKRYFEFAATNQSDHPIKIIGIEGTIRTEDGNEWNIRFFERRQMPSLYGGDAIELELWWGEPTPYILAPKQKKAAIISQLELASYYIDISEEPYPAKVVLAATYIAEDGTFYHGTSDHLPLASRYH